MPLDPLDHWAQGPVGAYEALGPQAQQVLEVLLDQTEKRRLARPSRPVDPTGDLHTSRPAGGRAPGESRRGACPSRPACGGREQVSTADPAGPLGRAHRLGLAAGHGEMPVGPGVQLCSLSPWSFPGTVGRYAPPMPADRVVRAPGTRSVLLTDKMK